MSRQPSPGIASSSANNGAGSAHMFHQASGMGGPTSVQPFRQKSRAYASGIAAGAEDVKYAAKYRELKKKVKEIEFVSAAWSLEMRECAADMLRRTTTSCFSKSCKRGKLFRGQG